MAKTANADRCEIVCGLAKIGKQKVEIKKSGRYIITTEAPIQDISLKSFKITKDNLEKLKNGKSYYKTLKKQEKYADKEKLQKEKLQEDDRYI